MTLIPILVLLLLPWASCRLTGIFQPTALPHLRQFAITGLSLVFLFTATGHFLRTEAMTEMLPEVIPSRRLLIHLTGLLEIAFVILLLIPHFRRVAGWATICFLVAVFPANIYAATSGRGLGESDLGLWYVLIRTPVQLALVGWTYWFAVRPPHLESSHEATAL